MYIYVFIYAIVDGALTGMDNLKVRLLRCVLTDSIYKYIYVHSYPDIGIKILFRVKGGLIWAES
jgi:hypothetical protein